jgi:Domain of unknown function (DUF4349)
MTINTIRIMNRNVKRFFSTLFFGLALGMVSLWMGCAKKPYSRYSDAYEMTAQAPAMESGYDAAPMTTSVAKSKSISPKKSANYLMVRESNASQMGPTPKPRPMPATKRMVHYSGNATLKSTEPEKILDSAIALVKAGGGYLEQRSQGFVALRVPSQDFDTLFSRLLKLATLLDFSQTAEDITEAFNDTDLRLKIVLSTLERLEDLVKKARTEEQKLRLLKDLQKYREEREILETQKQDIAQRLRFASIHLNVQSHQPWASQHSWNREIRDFIWIHRLNPFEDARFHKRGTRAYLVPAHMVESQKKNPWRATSAQGSEFWGSEIDVKLRGDSRFWREAIRMRLKEGFKIADTLKAGEYQFARFQSFGPTPYFYWVGVRSRGDEIDLAEFYFPTEAEQTQLLPDVLAAVEGKSK